METPITCASGDSNDLGGSIQHVLQLRLGPGSSGFGGSVLMVSPGARLRWRLDWCQVESGAGPFRPLLPRHLSGLPRKALQGTGPHRLRHRCRSRRGKDRIRSRSGRADFCSGTGNSFAGKSPDCRRRDDPGSAACGAELGWMILLSEPPGLSGAFHPRNRASYKASRLRIDEQPQLAGLELFQPLPKHPRHFRQFCTRRGSNALPGAVDGLVPARV